MVGREQNKKLPLVCSAKLSTVDYDALVIGGGVAGVSSAVYLSRAGYKVALIEKETVGGQIAVTDVIENYPGFPSVTGTDLATSLENQLLKWNVDIVRDEALSVRKDGHFTVRTYGGDLTALSIVVATGSSPRKLGVEGEAKFLGRGLSFCAFCDGAFFKDKAVAVVGGGDSAVKEAAYLSKIVSKVHLIHRRDKFRAERANVRLIEGNPKVEIMLNSVVIKFLGENKLEGVVVKNVQTGLVKEIAVEGVFEYIGRDPSAAFLELEKDDSGYIIVDDSMKTSVDGLYAAGECTSPRWKQLAVSAGEGAKAAMSAIEYLELRSVAVT